MQGAIHMLFEYKRYTYIMTILKEGSFSAAAKKLYISQSALSQFIKTIETEIGTDIFYRGKEGISLTYAGDLYLKLLETVRNEERSFENAIAASSGGGTIRLALSSVRAQRFLPKVLPALYEELPDLDLQLIHANNREELKELVIRGDADFAITSGNIGSDLVSLPIGLAGLAVVVSERHPAAAKYPEQHKFGNLDEFRNDRFILHFHFQGGRKRTDRIFNDLSFTPKQSIEVFDNYSIMELVENDLGVTVIDRGFAEVAGKRYRIRIFDLDVSSECRSWLIYRGNMTLSGSMKTFINICQIV